MTGAGRSRRAAGSSGGVVPVLKPPGMTSHDVVDWCRRLFGLRRVGHAGTLDPAAAGVLVICLGPATRLAEYLSEAPKAYRAEIWLGVTTDSLDSEGQRVEPPGPPSRPAAALDEGTVRRALAMLSGPQLQVPPAVSAVRQDGRRAYHRHREGEAVELEARPVTVYRFELLAWWPGPVPRLLADVVCSKGTYVRALARDLGRALGVPALLGALVRTAQGAFRLEQAVTLEDLAAAAGEGPALVAGAGARGPVVPPAQALAFLPAWVLDPGEARRVVQGGRPRVRSRPWDRPPEAGMAMAGDAGAGEGAATGDGAATGAPAGACVPRPEGGRAGAPPPVTPLPQGTPTPPVPQVPPVPAGAGTRREPGAGGGAAAPRVRLLDEEGHLLAVARLQRAGPGWAAVPEKVFPPELRQRGREER
ncbi:tRNA pseudouridine(55) synthase TruB [Thermaerobacter subterraneus]|uniref:tRNA pseudouridine synthase B n=1 Tax=Thermaerobacter subterraneus DSM 13965 TaxID=867903 RepID=K6QBD1_9FIRM|nr:tRNA pseudouridine(55) synthase TruB [Thermaerobacter subterraneus]EKP93636.1 tRNA pseudouridine 55 synthase [Thermaerobacter subterraneus DSM 13965]